MNIVEQQLAGKLFGSENLKKTQDVSKNPTPLMIYCQNQLNQDFDGDIIGGFSSRFCNDFYPTPTDVGICMTKNVDIKELMQEDINLFAYMNARDQEAKTLMSRGNRNSESTYILLADIFEDLNPTQIEQEYLVRFSIFFIFLYTNVKSLNSDNASPNQSPRL